MTFQPGDVVVVETTFLEYEYGVVLGQWGRVWRTTKDDSFYLVRCRTKTHIVKEWRVRLLTGEERERAIKELAVGSVVK